MLASFPILLPFTCRNFLNLATLYWCISRHFLSRLFPVNPVAKIRLNSRVLCSNLPKSITIMPPKRKAATATKTKASKKVKDIAPIAEDTNGHDSPIEDNIEIDAKMAMVEKAEPAKKKATRGNKAKQEEVVPEVEEPSKNKKKAPKPKKAAKEDNEEETVPAEPEEASKGRKRAPAKKAKEENGVESEVAEEASKTKKRAPAKNKKNKEDDEVVEEPEKKAAKGRKKAKSPEVEVEDEPEVEKKTKGKKPKVEVDEEVNDEPQEKPKEKGKKKAQEKPKKEEEAEVEEKKVGKGRKKAAPKRAAEPASDVSAKKAAPMNATMTQWSQINFLTNAKHSLKITSWNVDGIRAWLKKDGVALLDHEKPHIFCLQETKCSDDKLPEELKTMAGYHTYWCSSKKDGYAGVGLISKSMPIEVKFGIGNDSHDEEGRCITAEYEKFFLVNVYVPNAGRRLVTLPKRLEWNQIFKDYIKGLDQQKPVIICGDMNVAHSEIDLTNPKTNTKNAGFTKEEREGLTEFLKEGFVDTFRKLYPDQTGAYTFWSYMGRARSKNVGWRLDYFIASERITGNISDNVIRSQVLGSDHCPITLFLDL